MNPLGGMITPEQMMIAQHQSMGQGLLNDFTIGHNGMFMMPDMLGQRMYMNTPLNMVPQRSNPGMPQGGLPNVNIQNKEGMDAVNNNTTNMGQNIPGLPGYQNQTQQPQQNENTNIGYGY